MKRLNQLRLDAGLSITDVARATGVDEVTACAWLSGTRQPDERQLTALAALLDVHPDELDEPEVVEPPRRIDRIKSRLTASMAHT